MRIRFPKSNIEWTVSTEVDPWMRGGLCIRGEYKMPKGKRAAVESRVSPFYLENPEAADHFIQRMVEDLAREVGREMLFGAEGRA